MIPRLSARLQAVADLVLPGMAAADIGCDHAQLPAWWVASGTVPRAIASDVRPGPLQQARKVLRAAGLTAVEIRQGSGLSTLRPGEVGTVALAGMGGPLMLDLLGAADDVVASIQRVILQPNTAWTQVRAALATQGVPLQAETLTEEAGHTYLTLAFDPNARGARWNDADIELGPLLRRDRPPVFITWTERRLAHLKALSERLAHELGRDHARVVAVREERRRLLSALETPTAY